MTDKKPELMLYLAHCYADGCSEGDFRLEGANNYLIQRHHIAIRNVEREISLGYHLEYSGMDLVGSEKEAQELLALCQKEFQGVNPIIQLSHCAHGRIVFKRKLEFGKHTLDDRDELIKKISEWEYMKEHNIPIQSLHRAFYPSWF